MPKRQHTVAQSLSLPRLVGGADRVFAILNGTVAAVLSYATFSLYFLPIAVVLHIWLRWMTTQDPWWRELLPVYDRFPDVYEPWPSRKMGARFKRPHGFDRDLPC